jgi:hypothetical protein
LLKYCIYAIHILEVFKIVADNSNIVILEKTLKSHPAVVIFSFTSVFLVEYLPAYRIPDPEKYFRKLITIMCAGWSVPAVLKILQEDDRRGRRDLQLPQRPQLSTVSGTYILTRCCYITVDPAMPAL